MRLAAYEEQGAARIGIVSADGQSVQPLQLDGVDTRAGILPLITAQVPLAELARQAGPARPLGGLRLRAPVPRPARNIFCVGRNYHEHANELSGSIFKDSKDGEAWPIIFSKVPESVVGPADDVRLPQGISADIDYEAELCLVIGKQGKNIARAEALDYVYGYTIVNDVTARDVQQRHRQWHLGKSFDTFCPMGPWVVTADELDAGGIDIRCLVNGEVRQSANTRDLIFDIGTIIENCSRGITLYPGDLIATGTPAGVGMGMDPPRFLKDGDVVRVEIQGIGHIENTFKA
ncbi:fumarylacetoacetate hydrolase family protein [Bordetella petrii]|uniref:Fumarylacetoacetate hydrolase family protein n=1 Tax=Bordetella petrii (strain ATCC BAA-461 / DSM 12804 / CCUG 43448 / CIP 107267 / Se-1111R) TaxID=340100 RepID=A9I6H2_BORPD|nr:fumarylacetoacetate hydrolase family protein [Bordetella petrii]CAP44305.1 fumarylacetoacetate hydrolase family protein [Bordetella petrii]